MIIGAFFISFMDRPQYNGTYCATAFWSKQYGFHVEYWKQQIDLLHIPKGVARICYKDSIYKNGWSQIEIETQRIYPDWVQAYGAGIIEGALTWYQIYNHWFNTIQSSCDRDDNSQNFCTWLRDVITDNFMKIKEKAIKSSTNDHYWHQMNLYFEQLQGLKTGYQQGAKRARSDLEDEISLSDFLLMNSAADIQELKIYYENYVLPTVSENKTEQQELKNFFLPSATMLLKIVPGTGINGPSWQLLFGHSSAGSYASMLRVQKRYKFHYHYTTIQKSNTIPGIDITFTGYPGILASTDDFYIIRGRQLQAIVAGVAIKNENLHLWQTINLKEIIPLSVRVMAANRLSQNRRTWIKAMSRQPFTGSKQWLIVDLNKLNKVEKSTDNDLMKSTAKATNNKQMVKDLIWIAEQLPGLMHAKDVTEYFVASLEHPPVWLANGTPFFGEILQASAINIDSSMQPFLPIAESENLNNLESIDKYLRAHGFRGDIMNTDDLKVYGNIDIKLFAYNARLGISDYQAIAGPLFMHIQHMQATKPNIENDKEIDNLQINLPLSSIRDDRLTVEIDKADLEIISEKRSVRNDIRALAIQSFKTEPFKWPSVTKESPPGHPNEWNFDKISPDWAW